MEYIKTIQEEMADIFTSDTRINKTFHKLNNIQDIKIAQMLEYNKDYSYFINFNRLKKILDIKYESQFEKLKSENSADLITSMELINFQTKQSQYFNLNLDRMKFSNFIYAPVDGDSVINAFNFELKKIVKIEIDLSKINLPYIPKFSRSLNILNKLYVCGGEISNQITTSFFEVEITMLDQDAPTNTIKKLNNMEHGRSGHSVINIDNNKFFVVSGAYSEKTCEYYDFGKGKWHLFPGVNEDRIGSSLLLRNNEDLYCFFGKKYDVNQKKWIYHETVEKVNLYDKYPKWNLISFRNLISDNVKRRAFSGVLTTPSDKVYILGGQTRDEGITKATNNIIQINIDDLSISPAEVNLPKPTTFLDNNFYIFHNNNAQFDVNGNIFFYSLFYKEMWIIENC